MFRDGQGGSGSHQVVTRVVGEAAGLAQSAGGADTGREEGAAESDWVWNQRADRFYGEQRSRAARFRSVFVLETAEQNIMNINDHESK